MTEKQRNSRFDDMALYDLQHVRNALVPLLSRPGPLTPADLEPYDQLHYLGHQALDNAVTQLGVIPGAEVVDIGAGLGGPARYLAERYECHLTAVELQPELHELSEELTSLCGLPERVRAIQADVLTLGGAGWSQRYDHLLSLLAILHIPRRDELFGVCRELLRPGGTFYIEDFYARRPLTDEEQTDLAGLVACPYLPDEAHYREDLARAGFTDVTWTDATDLWLPWVRDRAETFRHGYQERVRLHGEPLAGRLMRFYGAVSALFTGGGVGGVRLTGRRG
ncbi:SAM-dependent methyltransferase [Streptomyces sporangiiformans]|uniref:Methyltransferase domain-containing protein n=1 Tax=Streptomyces sporangiiformans TaxID=2315329 RepID=A0A505CYS0_9ACTN|nr:class I SAM-dependent methyltransferase [Streptomyces sporangiiformans]TPQ15490.1 methyltransferase domain-containing protein [Streptomyces sporangiiformans]